MKPILFNTDMVRALLEERKTVTRRVIKPQPKSRLAFASMGNGARRWSYPSASAWKSWDDVSYKLAKGLTDEDREMLWTPPCCAGDILYVRETWYYEWHMHDRTAGEPDLPGGRYSQRYIFKADQPDYPVDVGVGPHGWKPSIHMPKEAARIFLRVKAVRVERLQDITEEQARAEGFYPGWKAKGAATPALTAKQAFMWFWLPDVWTANPWVWVIEFEKITKEEAGQ